MKEEDKRALKDEARAGREAAQLMEDSVLGRYFKERREHYVNLLVDVSMDDPQKMIQIKRQLFELDALRDEINDVILTGEWATQSLAEDEAQTNATH